ncbi:alpha/beta hydrolase family esterase [Tautonia rosea]|uniref:alpha/beta hydrolase family esterase n=1 Tax=Tautonia rosea TaxID=2728037 RepID=UPI0014739549|nr:PHB depolymerase family esterase [Tautonia rosea]
MIWTLVASVMLAPLGSDAPKGFEPGSAVDRVVAVGEEERAFRLYVPSEWSRPAPALFVFHGEGGTPDTIQNYAKLDPLAEDRGFVVIYPKGEGKNWNYDSGAPIVRSRGFASFTARDGLNPEMDRRFDDVAMVRSIVEELGADGLIDVSRVFATGISSGAMFCHRLAADASDVMAGVAPVSGAMTDVVAERFAPTHPVSLMAIIGEDDPLMPVTGGPIAGLLPQDRGRVAPADETIAAYLQANGISGEPSVETLPDRPEDDGTTTRVYSYPSGHDGVLVEIYRIEGAGHNWPGKPSNYHVEMVGKTSQDFDGSEAILSFFERCPPKRITQ